MIVPVNYESTRKFYPTDEELKLMAHKCSIGCKGSKGSAKVLHEEDMYKIYKAAL